MTDGEVDRRVLRIGRCVDASTLPGRNDDVTISAEHFGSERYVPLSDARSGPERKIGRAFVAVGSLQRESRPAELTSLGLTGDELHNSAEGVAAVKIGRSAAENFHIGE